MATAQTQWYKAILTFGGVALPVGETPQLIAARNIDAPPIIGNFWQFNYAEGLIQPVVDVSCIIRDKASEWLSATVLNQFLSRSNDVAHDTTALSGGIAFWDGRTGWTMAGAKADSFTIHITKGERIGMTARFCGTTLSALGSAPSFSAWDNSRLLRGQHATVGGAQANRPWGIDCSFSNNHTPDMALDGTNTPAAWNAGMQSAGLSFQSQAADADPADGTAIAFTITGTGRAITFTLNNPIDNASYNRIIQAPRVMRAHQFVCLGSDGQTTAPLTISSTF